MDTTPPAEIRTIDGDTIRIANEVIRIEDLDAPESGNRAECDSERLLARHATDALRRIIANGPARIDRHGKDRFGRTLAIVTVNGKSVGVQMVELGFAEPWRGRQHDWCRAKR